MSRLFHVSDLHFGAADMRALAWFKAEVDRLKPDAVLCTGDLTMAARTEEYAAAGEWLATIAAPISLQPGNHDVPVYNPFKRLLFPWVRYARLAGKVERELDLPDLTVVSLRTATRAQLRRNWSLGVVRGPSLRRAVAAAKAAPAGHLTLVACHHPLADQADTVTPGKTRGGVQALHALAAAGADAVLSGHVHDPFDVPYPTAAGPIRMIGAGTLSERLRTHAPSFNELIVENGRLEVLVRTEDGRVFEAAPVMPREH